jgi:hypothetical protein
LIASAHGPSGVGASENQTSPKKLEPNDSVPIITKFWRKSFQWTEARCK